MPPILDGQRKWLLEDWLPRVRDHARRRRPIKWLMIGILLLGLAVCVLSIVVVLLSYPEHLVVPGGFMTLFLGYVPLCVRYVGKLQTWNDQALVIELAIVGGDWDDLFVAVKPLGGYGNLGRMVKDDDKRGSRTGDSSDERGSPTRDSSDD